MMYIGDRADSSVCAIDENSLERKTCGHIDSTPDGVVYVAPTKEVWVTAPRDNTVRILDAQTLIVTSLFKKAEVRHALSLSPNKHGSSSRFSLG